MQNAGERSRALVIRLGIMTNKLQFFRYGVPKPVIAELIALKKDMRADDLLRECGQLYFEMLDDLISFVDVFNSGNKELAAKYMAQVEAKWNVMDSLLMEGVKEDGNGFTGKVKA